MKRAFSIMIIVVMMLGILAGCNDDFTLKDFDLDIGDDVVLGKYQDEEIEWEVMSRNFLIDEGKVRVELLSKYALDCVPFNEDGESTWEDCSLREWLNTDFYEEAFSNTEKKHIVDSTYYCYTDEARFLTDKVYLIGMLKYRMHPEDALCKPTKYAKKQGITVKDKYCNYWTRDIIQSLGSVAGGGTAGVRTSPAIYSNTGGFASIPDDPYKAEDVGVRPVICVEYKIKIDKKCIEDGDTITMGTYDEEPIEWFVIDNNKGEFTLFSKYGLCDKRMDKNEADSFEETELYEWLNDDFYNEAFNKKEKKRIVKNDLDGFVTLADMDQLVYAMHCTGNDFLTGYSKACYENDDDLLEIDTFWTCEDDYKDKKGFYVFNISRMMVKTDPDMKCSIRPVITIKI
ncbi:MAG: DUF6273 domain-containing protein [Clostridia bacterium]|nr:DUF6273 domain-containing protein [Clostridia bacterium]